PRNTIARKPSHLGSYRNPGPLGSASASRASIGSIGGAIGQPPLPSDPASGIPIEASGALSPSIPGSRAAVAAKGEVLCYTDGTPRRASMASQAPKYAWMNGKIIPWDQCVVHGRSAGGFMGSNVFEGVRAYWNDQQGELFVFKHEEHLQRLARSMKTVRMEVPFTLREIGRGALDLLRANEFREDAHFIPVAFFGMGAQNFN